MDAASPGSPLRPDEATSWDCRFAAVDDESIRILIDRFYAKVRRDPDLGPVFERMIAPDAWPPHLATMRDFWSSVMLTTGRYKGNPLAVHMRIEGIRPELFERWLELFGETADDLFAGEIAAVFKLKAGRIAQSLQIGLFYRPELDRVRAGP